MATGGLNLKRIILRFEAIRKKKLLNDLKIVREKTVTQKDLSVQQMA